MAQNIQLLTKGNLAKGNAAQLLICIIVDTSYSMIQENRIEIVNNGIKHFIEQGQNNVMSCDSLDLCLISCGGTEAKIIQEFKNITEIPIPTFKAEGGTPMASAIELALDRIEKRRNQLHSNGFSLYKSWLVILSDGNADSTKDNIDNAVDNLQTLFNTSKLKSKCIAIGNEADIEELKRFSSDGTVERMDALEIDEFFYKLSTSMAALSGKSPDDEDDSEGIL